MQGVVISMKKATLMIVISFCLLFMFNISTSASPLEYPANQDKHFVSENEFYQQLDKKVYKEYEDAAYSVRKKLSYKEVPNAELTFLKKTGEYFGQEKQELADQISPDRQVYFLASFYQNSKEEFHKFIVIDAETKVNLYCGNRYHQYENQYKK